MRLLGWSMSQWARAAAGHEAAFGYLPIPSMSEMLNMRRTWQMYRRDEPGEVTFVGVTVPENFAFVGAVIDRVPLH